MAALVSYLREIGCYRRIIVMFDHLTNSDHQAYEGLIVSGFFHKPFEASLVAELILAGR